MNQLEFGAVLAVTVAIVAITYLVYRYYQQKLVYGYKTNRLEYDDFVMADGGEDGDE